MPRLIDADAFLERNKEFADRDFNHPKYEDTLRELVDDEPTVDAVPRQKYEEDMENAFAHGYTDAESKYRKMIEGGELVELPTVEEHRDEAWEMFSLITSVWHGKQYYFMQDNGLVYSRKSHLTMTKGDALDEFLKEIGSDA